ncbi:hypothetical protein HYZ78_03690 [Candidatus Microgenomates bacterium]|nr:hypothetical protein [Candidatus Microgenomates bacterium]
MDDEGNQFIDAQVYEDEVVINTVTETIEGETIKIVFNNNEVDSITFSVDIGSYKDFVTTSHGLSDNDTGSFTSHHGPVTIFNDKTNNFVSVEDVWGDKGYRVRYKIPRKINTDGFRKIVPHELVQHAYEAPPETDKWRTADFLEVLGIERGEAEKEAPEL